MKTDANRNALLVLLVSLCWGSGGPLVWIASKNLAPYDVTMWRCLVAFLILSPFFLIDGITTFRQLDAKAVPLLAGAGIT